MKDCYSAKGAEHTDRNRTVQEQLTLPAEGDEWVRQTVHQHNPERVEQEVWSYQITG